MSIDASFYENVLLLMQVVPASQEFKKYFRKGMFQKPNTTGFIHVSHYLLSIHNADRFKSMITWPILTKRDETKYRIAVKDYLTVLSNENPDIQIPRILVSHLILAKGPKILTLIWKFSQIALRSYIERERNTLLLRAPGDGKCSNLTTIYFQNQKVNKDIYVSDLSNKKDKILETVATHINEQDGNMETIKTEIFETTNRIKQLVSCIPASGLSPNRLINVEDTEIIDLWKASIMEKYTYLLKKNMELKDLQEASSIVRVLTLKLLRGTEYFDFGKYPIESDSQDPDSSLYLDGTLVLRSFLLLTQRLMKNVLHCLERNGIPNICNHKPELDECCDIIETAKELIQELGYKISNEFSQLHMKLEEKTSRTYDSSCLYNLSYDLSYDLLQSSPKMNFYFNESANNKLLNRFWLSPKQDQYKQLFQRYVRQKNSFKTFTSQLQMSYTTKCKSPNKLYLSDTRMSPLKDISSKYSRLFYGKQLRANYPHELNAASTPNQSPTETTSTKSNQDSTVSTSDENLDAAARNLFDLTCKVTDIIASLCKSPLQ